MPKSPVGKIDVAIAPSNPKRVYALIQTADQGSVWRSDDGGENWAVVNWQRALIGRAGYYIRLAVNPTNPDEVFVADSSFWGSTDGGKSFRTLNWGGDTHDIWIDPKNPNRILVTHDGGMYMTTDHGQTSNRVTLPIGQMYHVAVDNDVPYKIYGNMQDDGTMRGPSNVVEAGPNVPGQARTRGGRGGRGGAGDVGARPRRLRIRLHHSRPHRQQHRVGLLLRQRSYPLRRADQDGALGQPLAAHAGCAAQPGEVPLPLDGAARHRSVRSQHRLLRLPDDPAHHERRCELDRTESRSFDQGSVAGSYRRAESWATTSASSMARWSFPSRPQTSRRASSGREPTMGKSGTRRTQARTWNDVTKNITGLPAWGVVSKIEPSHFDAGTAYICVDFHLMDNRDPWVYKTTDFGKTWTKISRRPAQAARWPTRA